MSYTGLVPSYRRSRSDPRCHASHGTGCAATAVPVSIAFAGSV